MIYILRVLLNMYWLSLFMSILYDTPVGNSSVECLDLRLSLMNCHTREVWVHLENSFPLSWSKIQSHGKGDINVDCITITWFC